MSLQAPVPATQPAIPLKERRIPKRISEAIRLITTGEVTTQKAAAERVGITPGHLCETLKKPHIQVFIERQARSNITNGLMRASARVIELVDASSEHVSLDASKHVLAIAGIKPTADAQVSVNIDIKAGYVIDLSNEDKRPPIIDVTHD
jgi:pantoate kinase